MLREAGYKVTAADDGPGPEVELAALPEAPRPAKKKRKPGLKRIAKAGEPPIGATARADRAGGRK